MTHISLKPLVAAAVAVLCSSATAHAQARFINLADNPAFIARCGYSLERTVPDYQPEGWTFWGWVRIEPGEAWEGPAGPYYVKNDGGRVAWRGLRESVGFVTNPAFEEFVPKGTGRGQKVGSLRRSGFQEVKFQEFGDGNWTIGNDYQLKESSFDFNFSSRNLQHHTDWVREVPGRVVYFSHSGEWWGASGIAWGKSGNKVYVSLSTEGAQKRIGGPREPGYYRGRVTVYYTRRR